MNAVEIFPWNENFETGIEEIDVQHQQLVKLVNQLASHLAFQADLPRLDKIFDELAAYTQYHFATEEKIWHAVLPGDAWEIEHSKTHQSFIEDVMRLRNAQGAQSIDVTVEEILSFLCQWLAFHILYSDRRMAQAALAIRAGQAPEDAKRRSNGAMNSTVRALIETVLTMYDRLSNRTLQLVKELTTRQKLEAKLRLAGSVFDNTLEAICIVDAAGGIIDANPAFCQSCGTDRDALIGVPLAAFKSSLGDDDHAAVVWSTVNTTGHWSGAVQYRTPNGEFVAEWLTLSAIRDSSGDVGHYVAVFSSVGGLIQRQQAMEHWAHHDALTGLPNRLLLKDRLEQALAQSRRDRKLLAVCYLDLDDFKPVNDTFGHAAGDHVLQITAERIRKELRGTDTVARIGGDEFVILFSGLQQADERLACLERILDVIRQPISLTSDDAGDAARVSASIGVSLYPRDGENADALLQHADTALYQSKTAAKGGYRLYAPET